MSIYEKIKQLCEIKGTTIKQLEITLGFGSGTIHRWQNASPTVAKLQTVADYLGVTTSYLIGDENHQPALAETNPEAIKILTRATEELSDEDLKSILAIVNTFIESRQK